MTQKPYAEIIKNQILEPLGMDRSGFEYYQREIEDMAIGHKLKGNNIVPAENRIMQNVRTERTFFWGKIILWRKISPREA